MQLVRSHHGTMAAFPADKMMPIGNGSYNMGRINSYLIRRVIKKIHKKKQRAYNKNLCIED